MADFWRIKDFNPTLWDKRGVSLVLVNTNKGDSFISRLIKLENNVIGEVPLKYATYVYARIRTDKDSPYQSEIRDRFLQDVYEKGYKQALISNGLKTSHTEFLIYKFKLYIKSIIRRK